MSKIKNPRIIRLTNFKDFRGKLSRVFCTESLKKKNLSFNIKQINHVLVKKKATIKGMHIQLQPFNEIKLVKVIKGKIFDVVLDLRKNSKNFLKYKVFILDSSTDNLLIIPKGFAHGFQSLTNNCEIIYCHSETYNPKKELSINPLDPNISINWPLKKPIISSKDLNSQYIYDDFKGIVI
jgi:dTDP-4-dehydrorhamnose 3,5-epimerase|tara:strand:+ start:82 stop:621 length:540 start_codon:yes stop_codon:yes gene_type:complete